MPRIRPGMKKPPPGFEKINDKLDEFELLMKEAVQAPSLGVLPPSVSAVDRNGIKKESNQTRKRRREALNEHDHDERNRDSSDNPNNSNRNRGSQDPVPKGEEAEAYEEEAVSVDDIVKQEQEIPPLWRVAQINRDRTRYVYDCRYRHQSISQEVYDYCCEMQFIDAGLARRWRLPGYEKLCCTACGIPGAASTAAQLTTKFALRDKPSSHRGPKSSSDKGEGNGGEDQRTCICRVPIGQRRMKHFEACTVCGCKGCSSSQN